jgi:hypothetical protein
MANYYHHYHADRADAHAVKHVQAQDLAPEGPDISVQDTLAATTVSRTARRKSCDTGRTDPHAEALTNAKTKTAAIRYAVGVLAGAPPSEIMAWLARYGYKVSRSMVSPEVSAYKHANGLATGGRGQAAPPTKGDRGYVRRGSGGGGHTTASVRETDLSVPTGDSDFSYVYRAHRNGDACDGGDARGQESDTSGARLATQITDAPQLEQRAPWVAFACYAVAVVSLAVSLNTSWRFFDRVLHIPSTYGERYVMFAVAELALVVCGAGMAVNVHRDGRPRSFRLIVWGMCAAMAYMAWAESSTEEAVGRILLGPVLGTVMLHLGLGLELRARHQHTGTVARIGRELRERCLSRLGLADDGRDAAQRTRDRKAYAAAALSRPRRWPWSRQTRLERALLAAGVADDEAMRDRMLKRLAVVSHAHKLSALDQPSPWHPQPVQPAPSPKPRVL